MKKSVKKSIRFKPSMRQKKRYLVLKSNAEELRKALSVLERGTWKIIVVGKDRILARVNLKEYNLAREIFSSQGIKCIGASGTIKRAKQKFWGRILDGKV